MRSVRLACVVAMTIFFIGGILMAQDGKRIRGTLPPGYGKLGLSDEQKQNIYKAQAEFDAKIEALEVQLTKLRKDRRAAIDKSLTKAQRDRLREMAQEKLPAEDKKPEKQR